MKKVKKSVCFCSFGYIVCPHSVYSLLLWYCASPLLLMKMTSKLRQFQKRRLCKYFLKKRRRYAMMCIYLYKVWFCSFGYFVRPNSVLSKLRELQKEEGFKVAIFSLRKNVFMLLSIPTLIIEDDSKVKTTSRKMTTLRCKYFLNKNK